VAVGVVGLASLELLLGVVALALVGELVGVICRSGEGDDGESTRRNGEFRTLGGEP
jgi:hypothetical protein